MKWNYTLIAAALLVYPTWVNAQSAEFNSLLVKIPAPPLSVGAAVLRWHEGHEVSGGQQGFDKSADILLAKLDSLEKTQQTTQFSYGGQTADQIKDKMAGMTQQEKIAYAMQMAKQSQADQQAAYTGSNAQALMQSQQNDAADAQKGLASEKAAKEMSDLDDEYNTKFEALETKMLADVKGCPTETIGQASGPDKGCVQVILAQYKKDYNHLAEDKMIGYNSIYLEFKKAATAEIKGWEADIDSVQADGSETAKNQIVRKKMLIYEDIRDLTLPADKAVNLGYETAQMDPWKVCGGNCEID